MNRCRAAVMACLLALLPSLALAQTLLPNAQQQFLDSNGAPLAGGFVYTYVLGTTTPKLTWQDQFQQVANTNPLVLDSAGRATIWGDGSYRQIVQDSAGNVVWDQTTASPQPPTEPPPVPPVTYFGKSFTADLLVDQTVGTSIATVLFNQMEFDSIGGYSIVTGTFTPTIRGVYLVTTSIYYSGTITVAGGNCFLAIWRNGLASRVSASPILPIAAGVAFGSVTVTGIFQLNGAGDNLQVKSNCQVTGTAVAKSGSSLSYLSGAWIGSY